jgi:hypothetical protein
MRRDTYSRCLGDFLNWMRRCTEERTSYSTAGQKVRPSACLRACDIAAVKKSTSRPWLWFRTRCSSHLVANEQSACKTSDAFSNERLYAFAWQSRVALPDDSRVRTGFLIPRLSSRLAVMSIVARIDFLPVFVRQNDPGLAVMWSASYRRIVPA